jgi:hypothetical protein
MKFTCYYKPDFSQAVYGGFSVVTNRILLPIGSGIPTRQHLQRFIKLFTIVHIGNPQNNGSSASNFRNPNFALGHRRHVSLASINYFVQGAWLNFHVLFQDSAVLKTSNKTRFRLS